MITRPPSPSPFQHEPLPHTNLSVDDNVYEILLQNEYDTLLTVSMPALGTTNEKQIETTVCFRENSINNHDSSNDPPELSKASEKK